MLLLVGAFLILTGFQTLQLARETGRLVSTKSQQENAVEESRKVRVQLDALARGTKELADAGNRNARRILSQLESQGVRVNLSSDVTAD